MKRCSRAEFDPPDMGKLSIVVFDNKENISLLPTTIAVSLVPATTFTGLALLLSMGYFWLFLAEAKLSHSYPAPCALFGVFKRTGLRGLIFFVLITVPAGAIGVLAWWSFNFAWWNTIIAVVVILVCCLIAREFYSSASRMRMVMQSNYSDAKGALENEGERWSLPKAPDDSSRGQPGDQ